MSRFFNQEKIEVEEHKNYNNIIIKIDLPEENYGLDYFKEIDEIIGKTLSNYNPSSEPVMLSIIGEFKQLKKQKFEDYKELIMIIKSLLGSHIVDKNKPLEREKRLGLPRHLKGIELSDLVLMSFINNHMKFSILGIEVKDIKGKIIERVF